MFGVGQAFVSLGDEAIYPLFSVFALLATVAVNSAQGQATLVNAPDTVLAIDTMASPAKCTGTLSTRPMPPWR